MLETMRLIALAVHPSRLPGDYRFETRNELIGYIKVMQEFEEFIPLKLLNGNL